MQVRVREKHQITLPAALVREANIQPNDVLDVSFQAGVITLSTAKSTPGRSILDLAGSTRGLYGEDAKAQQNYLDSERAAWDR